MLLLNRSSTGIIGFIKIGEAYRPGGCETFLYHLM